MLVYLEDREKSVSLHRGAAWARRSGDHGVTYRRLWKLPLLSKLTVFARTPAALFRRFHARAYCSNWGARLQAEVFHDRVFVKGHGARRHIEEVRDVLHRTAFREELQHFALTPGELLQARLHGIAGGRDCPLWSTRITTSVFSFR